MKSARTAAILLTVGAATAANAKDTRFWNLTAHTIISLQLSPAGNNDWGPDQIVNDPDHSVDHDERLKITGAPSGRYDVKFIDNTGRHCLIAGVDIREGAVFAIEEKKLGDCGK